MKVRDRRELLRASSVRRIGKGLRAAPAIAAIVLAGCDLGPDYRRPELQVPSTFQQSAERTEPVWPSADWWRGFESPQLDELIAQAQVANFDIAAAVARVREADAQARIAGAALLPQVSAGAGARRIRAPGGASGLSAAGVGGTTIGGVSTPTAAGSSTVVSSGSKSTTEWLYNTTLSASYEIDFWGKNRASLQSAQALAVASRFDQETVAITVVSNVATTYFQIQGLRDQLNVVRDNLATAEHILDVVKAQLASGTTSTLQLSQQESVVAGLRATIPPLEQQIQQSIYALSTLVGKPPEEISVMPGKLTDVSIPEVAPGLPSELLTRRPDVRAAEAQLVSLNANIKVARAQFFPSIDLTAIGGFESVALSSLFGAGGAIYSLGASISQPIFTGGLLEGQLEFSKAQYDEFVQNYRKSVVSAFTDVESALVAIRQTAEQEARQQNAVDTARRAYEISDAQLRQGIVDLLTVLDTQQTLFQAQQTLVQVRLTHMQAIVSLFLALGGGWDGTVPDTQVTSK